VIAKHRGMSYYVINACEKNIQLSLERVNNNEMLSDVTRNGAGVDLTCVQWYASNITYALLCHYPMSNIKIAMLALVVSLRLNQANAHCVINFITQLGDSTSLQQMTVLLVRVAMTGKALGIFEQYCEQVLDANRVVMECKQVISIVKSEITRLLVDVSKAQCYQIFELVGISKSADWQNPCSFHHRLVVSRESKALRNSTEYLRFIDFNLCKYSQYLERRKQIRTQRMDRKQFA